jgi:hypothetical protein
MAAEFVNAWEKHNNNISSEYDDFDLPVHHRVFTRPSRALRMLVGFETLREDAHLRSLPTFAIVCEAFAEKGEDVIVVLFKQLYSLALDRVERSAGRYLSGVYLLGGIADPKFCPVIFEALVKPEHRTKFGLRLEKWISDHPLTGYHKSEFAKLTSPRFLHEMMVLSKLAEPEVCLDDFEERFIAEPDSENRKRLVDAIMIAKEGSFGFVLRSWRSCFSNTQPVELSFLTLDTVKSSGSFIKGKQRFLLENNSPCYRLSHVYELRLLLMLSSAACWRTRIWFENEPGLMQMLHRLFGTQCRL